MSLQTSNEKGQQKNYKKYKILFIITLTAFMAILTFNIYACIITIKEETEHYTKIKYISVQPNLTSTDLICNINFSNLEGTYHKIQAYHFAAIINNNPIAPYGLKINAYTTSTLDDISFKSEETISQSSITIMIRFKFNINELNNSPVFTYKGKTLKPGKTINIYEEY